MKKRDIETLLSTLLQRFEAHRYRHQDVAWNDVLKRVDWNKDALTSLLAMESSGGSLMWLSCQVRPTASPSTTVRRNRRLVVAVCATTTSFKFSESQ